MLPPGRRRAASMAPATVWLALLLLFTSTARAASSVLGLDFGTLNLKAALVKPGIPLEIVLTKDSKRKEAAAVGFKPNRDSNNNIIAEVGTFPERAYGSDALALQGRMPGEVYPNLKPLLGLSWSETAHPAIESYKERHPSVRVEQAKEPGTTLFKSQAFVDEEMPWSVEELLAMELANIRRNAEALAGKGSSVEDAVITVPAFYTADERRAIGVAANLAGMEVNALISDGLAVGLDYAKSRTFAEVTKGGKAEHHVVFDMGAGSATASVLRFQGRSVKDVGRFNKTVQEVAVLGTGWDRTLGGDSLTNMVVNDYVQKFMTKPVIKSRGLEIDEIKNNGRLMSRVWKEAEKARQVLSANTETYSSFEELLPEIDFKVKLTRGDFEGLTAEHANRVAKPIEDALAAAKMSMADIDSIILHGGAIRTPFVQKQLEKAAGGSSKIRSNVNADESAVFGAAFKGAGLSPSFKVKEIRNSDVAGYTAGMTYTDGGKVRRQNLFGATSPVGNGAATKQVSFKDKEDFSFGLYQRTGDDDKSLSQIQTSNLTASVKALKDKFGCAEDDISTKFSIRLNPVDGLPEVTAGSVSCEVEGSGKSDSIGDSVKDWLGIGKKKDQEPLDGEDAEPTEDVEVTSSSSATDAESASSSTADPSSSSKAPEKPKTRIESVGIAITTIPQGNVQPSTEEMKRMRDRLTAFDRSDRARVAREEALNVLESYTYYIRDFLTNPDYEAVSTKSQRDEINKLLGNARDFLEDPKEVTKATREVFMEKHDELKKLVEPIQMRRKEDVARPEKVEALKKSLGETEKLVEMVKEQVSQANEAKSKAQEFGASHTATAADSSASSATGEAGDDIDGLEEPDTTAAESPIDVKYEKAEDFSPYTDVDLTEISDAFDSVSKWLSEQEAAQAKLQPHEEPALRTQDIEAKANELSVVMRGVLDKKMKASQKASSAKKAKSSKTKSSKKTKSKTSTDAGEEATAAEEEPARITINPEDESLSEEEIASMISQARSSSSTLRHEEL